MMEFKQADDIKAKKEYEILRQINRNLKNFDKETDKDTTDDEER